MARLSEDAIRGRLASLRGWTRHEREIRKVYTFDGFKTAIAFVNRVAGLAEAMDHHPDLLVQYDKVTLSLTSHDVGGITERDFKLAHRIDS